MAYNKTTQRAQTSLAKAAHYYPHIAGSEIAHWHFHLISVCVTSWSIKVSIAAQKFATSITDCKGSDTTWELRMYVWLLYY